MDSRALDEQPAITNDTMLNIEFVFCFLPPPIPQTKSGANGKFLPKPLLFHLRLPNSKTNQPKFWQILSSPKNSFAKTSSAVAERYERTIQFQATTRSARAISHRYEFLIK